jgi:hypothetical protein
MTSTVYAPVGPAAGLARQITNPVTGSSYALNGQGAAVVADADAPWFLTQGYTVAPSAGSGAVVYAPFMPDQGLSRVITHPISGNSYTFNGAGAAVVSTADLPWFLSQGYVQLPSGTMMQEPLQPGLAAPGVITNPSTGNTYVVNGRGLVVAQAADVSWFQSQGFVAGGLPAATASTWNTADAATNNYTLTNANLTAHYAGSTYTTLRTSQTHSSGKLYVEFASVAPAASDNLNFFGVCNGVFAISGFLGTSGDSFGLRIDGFVSSSGGFSSGTGGTFPTTTPVVGDVYAFAVDFAAGKLYYAKNNAWVNGADPVGGTANMIFTPGTPLYAGISSQGTGDGTWALQAAAGSQSFAPPSGFSAWI